MQVYRSPHKGDGASCESVYTNIPLAPPSVLPLFVLFFAAAFGSSHNSVAPEPQVLQSNKVLYPKAPVVSALSLVTAPLGSAALRATKGLAIFIIYVRCRRCRLWTEQVQRGFCCEPCPSPGRGSMPRTHPRSPLVTHRFSQAGL